MYRGILQTALTTRLRLDLDYREPSGFQESGNGIVQRAEGQDVERVPAEEFACLLGVM
jgi:hypothetical protein